MELASPNSVLVDCGMDHVLNMDSPTIPQWTSTFKNMYKVADNNGWYTRALEKSSLANYLKFKIVPSLEIYLLDKIYFSGCTLKFKARTNTLNLEGNKKSWSVVNTGICKMCDICNSIETTDHFIFECSALNHIRDEAYNSLREALLNNNCEVLWDMFTQGDTDTKRFLLLGDLFQEDYSLGNSVDTCCKYYLSHDLYISFMLFLHELFHRPYFVSFVILYFYYCINFFFVVLCMLLLSLLWMHHQVGVCHCFESDSNIIK